MLFTGSTFGFRVVNETAVSGRAGNDMAFDNVRALDATPTLDQSYSPTPVAAGTNSTLTLTVTNTSELAAKNGWSFSDALPAGLVIGGTATTTCPNATLSAANGTGSISMTGDLSAGMTSCTITVPVTSASVATYISQPPDFTLTGLNPPAAASVAFVAAPVAADDSASTNPDQAVTVDVLSNDTSATGTTLDPASVQLLDASNNPVTTLTNSDGTYTVNPADGKITFTPAAGFTGPTTPVKYTVKDNLGQTSNEATLSITVAETLPGPFVTPLSGGIAAVVGGVGIAVAARRRRRTA